MTQNNVLGLYFALSLINGCILLTIALLFSAPVTVALLIGGTAALTAFAFLCLMCLPRAIHELPMEIKQKQTA
jgi:hypothetical protein